LHMRFDVLVLVAFSFRDSELILARLCVTLSIASIGHQTPRSVQPDAQEPPGHHPPPSIAVCPNDAHQGNCESDTPAPSTISASPHASAKATRRSHPSVAETRSYTRRELKRIPRRFNEITLRIRFCRRPHINVVCFRWPGFLFCPSACICVICGPRSFPVPCRASFCAKISPPISRIPRMKPSRFGSIPYPCHQCNPWFNPLRLRLSASAGCDSCQRISADT
jgi:hypothetical protein